MYLDMSWGDSRDQKRDILGYKNVMFQDVLGGTGEIFQTWDMVRVETDKDVLGDPGQPNCGWNPSPELALVSAGTVLDNPQLNGGVSTQFQNNRTHPTKMFDLEDCNLAE